jgi:hypothetical protein
MKTALSRIFEFFAGHDRREKKTPEQRNYCICGAFKSDTEKQERWASSKTESRPQRMNMAQK